MAPKEWPPLPWPWETWEEYMKARERFFLGLIRRSGVPEPPDWVFSEVEYEMWRSHKRFVGPWRPGTYLGRKTKDVIGRHKRGHHPLSLDALEEASGFIPSHGDEEEEWDNVLAARDVTSRVLPLLPPAERIVLEMRYWGRFSLEEIGQGRQSKPKTVKRTLNRVLGAARRYCDALGLLREMSPDATPEDAVQDPPVRIPPVYGIAYDIPCLRANLPEGVALLHDQRGLVILCKPRGVDPATFLKDCRVCRKCLPFRRG